MIFFGFVKLTGRDDFRHDPLFERPRFFEFGFDFFGGVLLLLNMIEDHRAVLGPHVRALAVELGRVVEAENFRTSSS